MGSRKELCATFVPRETPVERVESELRGSLERDVGTLIDEHDLEDRAEPSDLGNTWIDGWEEGWLSLEEPPSVERDDEAVYAVTTVYDSTATAAWEDVLVGVGAGDGDLLVVRTFEAGYHGTGTLYRWRGDRRGYTVVDEFYGEEDEYGDDVVAHFRDEYGVEGGAFRQWELETPADRT